MSRLKPDYTKEIFDNTYRINSSGEIFNSQTKMKTFVSKNGYSSIKLLNKGTRQSYYIHRLVAFFFVPNPNNKPCVNHIDGNKANNKAENLEWVTKSENTLHAHKLGLITNKKRQVVASLNGVRVLHFNSMTDAKNSGYNLGGIHASYSNKNRFYKGLKWQRL